MNTGVLHTDSQTISSLLEAPRDRRRFRAFFDLCRLHTIAYLRYLKSRGWRLPEDQFQHETGIEDLALDVLGYVLRSEPGRPFFLVLDFFGDKPPGTSSDSTELADRFLTFLHRHIRQQIYRISGEMDPQAQNLKKRVKDIVKGHRYCVAKESGVDIVRLASDRRRNSKVATKIEVDNAARKAFATAKNRAEWCWGVFQILGEEEGSAPVCRLRDLLTAMIAVNAEHIELYGHTPAALSEPQDGLRAGAIRLAIETAMEHCQDSVLKQYVERGRLSVEEAGWLLSAAKSYLQDFAIGNGSDLLPQYYREAMPESYHATYLKDHKNVFETVISKAREKLLESLRNDSTFL